MVMRPPPPYPPPMRPPPSESGRDPNYNGRDFTLPCAMVGFVLGTLFGWLFL